MERLRVLSRSAALKPAPLAKVYVARRERVVHPQRFGDLARDVSVARARHAVVQLRQKQHVAPAHQRVLAEHGDDFVETYAALDVPGGRAYRARVAERLARLRTRREASALDAVQYALDLRAQTCVERRVFERLRRVEPCEFREVRTESVFERRRVRRLLADNRVHLKRERWYSLGPQLFNFASAANRRWRLTLSANPTCVQS